MAANSSAHPTRAGYNQSGGAYFVTLAPLAADGDAVGTYINRLSAAGSNSGGAFVQPTLALVPMSSILGLDNTGGHGLFASTIVSQNKLLKDMGRTVVSAGRVFRKFAPVVATTAPPYTSGVVSSFGIVGAPAAGANAGFGSFYLEVGREGAAGGAPAPVARYF